MSTPNTQSAFRTYQLTRAGFDGRTDATDHLIAWVNAPSLEAVWRYAERKGWQLACSPETPWDALLTAPDGVDATIDADGNEEATP